jgi:hypothetical protein
MRMIMMMMMVMMTRRRSRGREGELFFLERTGAGQ